MSSLVVLSSSAHTDRILLHTRLLRALRERCVVRVWATSRENPRFQKMWSDLPADTESFPRIRPFREFPYNYLRRMNEFAWDFHLRDPSRLSMMREVRDKSMDWRLRVLRHAGRVIAALGWQGRLENRLEHLLASYNRSEEALERLQANRPEAILSTGSFRYEEPAVVGVAKRLKIPILAYITSWDNISIKSRMVFRYDAFLVWSERMRQELLSYYPQSRFVPIYVVGAPQFDVFSQPKWHLTREQFCRRLALRPDHPIIVQAMGVANGIEEHHGALDLAKRLARGELGDAQLIVRPHPFQNHRELRGLFREFAPRVVVQQHGDPAEARPLRSQDEEQVVEWVNTFRHADVVVHLSSTAAIDAAICDRPSVCLDYDPTPGQPNQALVKQVNHLWTHYRPVAESGGTRLVNDSNDLIRAIQEYLRHPELDRHQRRRMAEYVCGYLDGRCGERMAQAVLDFLGERNPNCGCAHVAQEVMQ